MSLVSLPFDPRLRLRLPEGRYALPCSWHEPQIDLFLQLVRAHLDPAHITTVLRIPATQIDTLPVDQDGTVLVVDLPPSLRNLDDSVAYETDLNEILARLSCRYVFLHRPPDDEEARAAFGWVERYLKPLFLRHVRQTVQDPQHPLASQGIANLPIDEAAALSPDPLVMIDLLDRTLHRHMVDPKPDLSPAAWVRELWDEAGRSCGELLMTLPGEEIQAALHVLLDEDEARKAPVIYDRGSLALARLGLARYVAGDLSLGPLVRHARSVRLGVGLTATIPPDRWPESTLSRLSEIHLAHVQKLVMQGEWTEASEQLDQLLAQALMTGQVRTAARARAEIAVLEAHRGHPEEAQRTLIEEVLPVLEKLDGNWGRSFSLGKIADILSRRGQLDEALRIRREEELPVYDKLGDIRSRAVTMGKIADIYQDRGQLDEALRIMREESLPVYDKLGDIRSRAVTMGQIADIYQARGQLDEALRIMREESLPVYDKLGDIRSRAVTMGKIADIYQARGQLDEALRIRREESLPVYDKLGDIRSRAVTMGQIADIYQARGQLDEALRIRREESLPVYDKLGDIRSRAVTMGQIADIYQARGQLDEALRIRREESLPVYDKLGDIRERVVTMGKIADIYQARGQLDEALRIRREESLPVYDKLGDIRERAVTMGKIADIYQARGQLDEALRIRREESLPVYDKLGDIRSRAVTMGQIANIYQARGQLNEALRIKREEELPVYDKLGDIRSRALTMGEIADIYQARGQLAEPVRILREEVLPVFERLGAQRDLAVGQVRLGVLLRKRNAKGDWEESVRLLQLANRTAEALNLPEADVVAKLLAQSRPRRR